MLEVNKRVTYAAYDMQMHHGNLIATVKNAITNIKIIGAALRPLLHAKLIPRYK